MSNVQDNFYSLSPKAMLTACAFSWIFSATVIFLLNWVPFEESHVSKAILYAILYLGYGGAALIFIIRFFVKKINKYMPSLENKRVTKMVLFISFIVIPVSSIFVFSSLDYFILVPISSLTDLLLRVLVWVLVFLWCGIQLKHYRQRIIDRKFVEKEFIIFEDKVIFRRPPKTSLEVISNAKEKKSFGAVYDKYGGSLFILVPFAYPLQRVLADKGGVSSVLFLLAVLGTPLTAYILMRLMCAFYLYVYVVLMLEKKHGKPVIYS